MKTPSVVRVIEAILRDKHRPLHYLEVTRLALKKHPLAGRTPQNTVSAILATDARFKRVAEGVYALASWDEYPAARFAKEIAYDILKSHKRPIPVRELGKRILRERQFKCTATVIARQAIRSDPRFYIDRESGLVGLSEWK